MCVCVEEIYYLRDVSRRSINDVSGFSQTRDVWKITSPIVIPKGAGLSWIKEFAEKRGLVYEENDEIKLGARGVPIYVLLKRRDNEYVVRIEVDRDEIQDYLEDLMEEGDREDVMDALEEMIGEMKDVALELISEMKRRGYKVRSEIASSVMDIRDVVDDLMELVIS